MSNLLTKQYEEYISEHFKRTNFFVYSLKLVIYVFVLLSFSISNSYALEVPNYKGYINDYADLLTPDAEQRLEQKLDAYEKETTNEIAFLSITSLQGDPIEDFAIRVFDNWKIGKADKDNGLLFLVSKNDREMRIEVGYGLEPYMTDGEAGSIIRNTIGPQFRNNNFEKGIEDGINEIQKTLQTPASDIDKAVGNNPIREIGGSEIDNIVSALGEFILIIPMALIYFTSYMARTKDVTLGGIVGGVGGGLLGLFLGTTTALLIAAVIGGILGLLLDIILSRNYQRLARQNRRTDFFHTWGGFGGGGGSWGSGGGFGGFGGGSSGGGGASGKW